MQSSVFIDKCDQGKVMSCDDDNSKIDENQTDSNPSRQFIIQKNSFTELKNKVFLSVMIISNGGKRLENSKFTDQK